MKNDFCELKVRDKKFENGRSISRFNVFCKEGGNILSELVDLGRKVARLEWLIREKRQFNSH